MNGDQLAILFIGLLFLVTGVGLLFVSVDGQAEERDKKRGWLAPDLPRKYPRCVLWECNCPPEDCGGVSRYFDFLEAVLNPTHKKPKRMIERYGKEYDPNEFNPQKVRFDNPKKRWKKAFQGR